jgi:hypothetical protein
MIARMARSANSVLVSYAKGCYLVVGARSTAYRATEGNDISAILAGGPCRQVFH